MHSISWSGQTNKSENFWTNKNSHFGPKHDVFGPKFGLSLSLTTYIEVEGHMIAQNDALGKKISRFGAKFGFC